MSLSSFYLFSSFWIFYTKKMHIIINVKIMSMMWGNKVPVAPNDCKSANKPPFVIVPFNSADWINAASVYEPTPLAVNPTKVIIVCSKVCNAKGKVIMKITLSFFIKSSNSFRYYFNWFIILAVVFPIESNICIYSNRIKLFFIYVLNINFKHFYKV